MADPPAAPTRATTIEELEALHAAIFTRESRERGLSLELRPSDVVISPFAKSGTTWLQQIAHGLRTRGSMAFDEITAVTPWIEVAHDLGWDLDAPQVAEPRVFKSHTAWHDVPKGGRYIVSFREPGDAFMSLFRFFEGFLIEPGAIDVETLFRHRFPPGSPERQGYWRHLASWWERRHDDDVLLLAYEDMKEDLPGTVRRVARLMEIELDDELLEIVVRQSSRAFMLEHADKFDDLPVRRLGVERGVLPPGIDARKVTSGARAPHRRRLPPKLERELDATWREWVAPRFGLEGYGALRRELQELNASGEGDRRASPRRRSR